MTGHTSMAATAASGVSGSRGYSYGGSSTYFVGGERGLAVLFVGSEPHEFVREPRHLLSFWK
jgi:hypothetical protein